MPENTKIVKKKSLRSSITKGTILILLKGEHEGRRVVFLRQLPSGYLLVTGPKELNKVPLYKIHQKYVIATSTKVNLDGHDFEEVKESLFKKAKKDKKDDLMQDEGEEKEIKDENEETKIKLQEKIDSVVMERVKKEKLLDKYLTARFALKKGQYPHQMKF